MLILNPRSVSEQIDSILKARDIEEEDQNHLLDIRDILDDAVRNNLPSCEITDPFLEEVLETYELMVRATAPFASEGGNSNGDQEVVLPSIQLSTDGEFDSDLIAIEEAERLARGDEASLRKAIILLRDLSERQDTYQLRAVSSLQAAEHQERTLFSQLQPELNRALEAGEFKTAEDLLKRLKALRPDDAFVQQASITLDGMQTSVDIEEMVEQAKVWLRRLDNFDTMLKGMEQTRRLVGMNVNDAELRRLYDEAEEVRRDVTGKLRDSQTMGSMGKFQREIEHYAELIRDFGIYNVEHPDRPGEWLKTEELLKKALDNLRNAQRATVEKRLQAADPFINSEPERALIILKDLDEFLEELTGTDQYVKVTDARERAEKNKERKEGSDKAAQTALTIRDPRERLAKLREALGMYPVNDWVKDAVDKAENDVRQTIRGEVDILLARANSSLNFASRDIAWDAIRSQYEEARKLLHELGDQKGPSLETLLITLEERENTLSSLQQEHNRIRAVAEEVLRQLKSGATAEKLDPLIQDLPKEHQTHILLSEARSQLAATRGDQQNYADAMRLYHDGVFDEAINLCIRIDPRGDLAKQAEMLHFRATIKRDLLAIRKSLNALNFAAAENDLLNLDTRLSKEVAQSPDVNMMAERAEIERFLELINNRRTEDTIYKQDLSTVSDTDLSLRADQLYALLTKYSARPELTDEINRIRVKIHDRHMGLVEKFYQEMSKPQADQSVSLDELRESLDVISKYGLNEDERETSLVEHTEEAYREALLADHRKYDRWDQVISTLEDYKLQKPLEALAMLRDAHRERALYQAREALRTGNHNDAHTLLEDVVREHSLRNDLEIILLQAVVSLYRRDFAYANARIGDALHVEDAPKSAAINQIAAIITSVSDPISRNWALAGQYAHSGDYDIMLDAIEAVRIQLQARLEATTDHREAHAYLTQLESNFRSEYSAWISSAVSGLMNEVSSLASIPEKIQKILLIQRLQPDTVEVRTHMLQIRNGLPDAVAQVIQDANSYDVAERPARDSFRRARAILNNIDNLILLPEYMPGMLNDEQLDLLHNEVRPEFVNKFNLIRSIQDQLEPYLQFSEAFEASQTPENTNLCIKYEKDQDIGGEILAIDRNPSVAFAPRNPDVRRFRDWLNETNDNRHKALDQVKVIKTAFQLPPPVYDESWEDWALDYETAYHDIIQACNTIADLTPNRQGDVYNMAPHTRIWDADLKQDVIGLERHRILAEERLQNLQAWSAWCRKGITRSIEAQNQEEGDQDPRGGPVRRGAKQLLPLRLENMEAQWAGDEALTGIMFGPDTNSLDGFVEGLEQLRNPQPGLHEARLAYEIAAATILQALEHFRSEPDSPNNPMSSHIRLLASETLDHLQNLERDIQSALSLAASELDSPIHDPAGRLALYRQKKASLAKKLGIKNPYLPEIKRGLIELFRLHSGDTSNNALLATYRAQVARRRK
jgi:hypothetical protein